MCVVCLSNDIERTKTFLSKHELLASGQLFTDIVPFDLRNIVNSHESMCKLCADISFANLCFTHENDLVVIRSAKDGPNSNSLFEWSSSGIDTEYNYIPSQQQPFTEQEQTQHDSSMQCRGETMTARDWEFYHARILAYGSTDDYVSFSSYNENPEIVRCATATGWRDQTSTVLSAVSLTVDHLRKGVSVLLYSDNNHPDEELVVASLTSICLNEKLREYDGFVKLVREQWTPNEHQFQQHYRTEEMTTESNEQDHITYFELFLDCVKQLMEWFPNKFKITPSLPDLLRYATISGNFEVFFSTNSQESYEIEKSDQNSPWISMMSKIVFADNCSYSHYFFSLFIFLKKKF